MGVTWERQRAFRDTSKVGAMSRCYHVGRRGLGVEQVWGEHLGTATRQPREDSEFGTPGRNLGESYKPENVIPKLRATGWVVVLRGKVAGHTFRGS